MEGLNENMLKALQRSSEDEFKKMYNPEVDKCFLT
jgi:hypothetical protein